MARDFPFVVRSGSRSSRRLQLCLSLAFFPKTDALCDREEQDTIGQEIIDIFDQVHDRTQAMRATTPFNEKACEIAKEAYRMANHGESCSHVAAKVHELLGQEITWVDEALVTWLKDEFKGEETIVGEYTKASLRECAVTLRMARKASKHFDKFGCSLASLDLTFSRNYHPTDNTKSIWEVKGTDCPSMQIVFGDGKFGYGKFEDGRFGSHPLAPRKDLPIMNRLCGFFRWGFGPLIKNLRLTMTSDLIILQWREFAVETPRANGRRVVKALTAFTKLARATWAKAKLAVHDEYWRREGKNFETESPWGIALKKRYIEYWNEATADFSDLAAYDRLPPTASDVGSSAASESRKFDANESIADSFSRAFSERAEEWLKKYFPVQGETEDGQLAVPRFHHPPFSPRVLAPNNLGAEVYERKWQDALHVRSASTSAPESSLPRTSLKRKLE